LDVSVIIPAYNEAEAISPTVRSVFRHLPDRFSFEVIVVDHGSTDDTRGLAAAAGARVTPFPHSPTIAAPRNLGVAQSTGRLLVFLDADTFLTSDWESAYPPVASEHDQNPYQISGSHPDVADDCRAWVHPWFSAAHHAERPSHLGGAHTITSRLVFERIGGFPEDRETGEDVRFCQTAKSRGIPIVA
jgi:glycosyltransferase involved in cell wall biosynthesis